MDYLNHLRKLDRLLRECGPMGLSVPRIIRETGVSRSASYRLMKRLKDMGAPIVRAKRAGFFRYEPGRAFELPGIWFSEAEIGALLGLMQWLGKEESKALEEVTGPLRKRLEQAAAQGGLDMDKLQSCLGLLPMHAKAMAPGVFGAVCEGLLAGRRLKLRHGHPGEERDRVVSPQKLVRYRDNWYLDAYCHEQEGLRSFALFRIRNARRLDKPARRLPREELRTHFADAYGIFGGPARYEAVIRFTGYAADWVESETWHPRERKSRTGDGLTLTVPYGNAIELVRDVLRWGDEAEVLRPASLRAQVAETLGKAARLYREP